MGLVTPVEPVPVSQLGRVHFVGIGGAGMSGVARILLASGVTVSGCDSVAAPQLAELAAAGAEVHVGHAPSHLDHVDTLVFTTAIRPDNPEIVAARHRGIPIVHRAAVLAAVMLGQRGIAIAGTHGKTTTASMITMVLRHCGAAPSYVVGGILAQTGVGAELGSGGTFVAEADESDGSFLMLSPAAAVITSIEADHLDNYGSLAEIEATFAAFARKITPGGLLVACADDPGARRLAAAAPLPLRVITYGESAEADYRVSEVVPRGMGTGLTVTRGGRAREAGAKVPAAVSFDIAVPGRHNALNAAAAFALAVELGFAPADIVPGLSGYQGARRRMEFKGEADGVRVLDSYAHHPTELAADLIAARDIAAGGRLLAIFQPHLFSRTRFFAAEFGAALGQADEVIVLDVYAAREDPEPGVTGALVAAAVPGQTAQFLADPAAVPAAVTGLAKPGDLVLTMGAGDVTRLGPLILAALRRRAEAIK
jgi:UDP-N-acetylmuramate--alanine ligase